MWNSLWAFRISHYVNVPCHVFPVMSSTRITNPTSRFSFHHLNSHSTSQCFWSKLSQWRRMASSNDINQSHQYKTPLQPGVRILISPLFCRIWKNEKPLFKLKFARYFCIWKKLQNAKCKKFFLRVSSWRDLKAAKKWKMKNAKLFFCRFHAFDWKIKSSQIAFCGAEKLDSTRRQRASQRLITRVGTSLLTGSEIWTNFNKEFWVKNLPPLFLCLLERASDFDPESAKKAKKLYADYVTVGAWSSKSTNS